MSLSLPLFFIALKHNASNEQRQGKFTSVKWAPLNSSHHPKLFNIHIFPPFSRNYTYSVNASSETKANGAIMKKKRLFLAMNSVLNENFQKILPKEVSFFWKVLNQLVGNLKGAFGTIPLWFRTLPDICWVSQIISYLCHRLSGNVII